MNWFDSSCHRSYESPQDYVDDAIRFDDVREGEQFSLLDQIANEVVWFKVERGKAVQLEHPP